MRRSPDSNINKSAQLQTRMTQEKSGEGSGQGMRSQSGSVGAFDSLAGFVNGLSVCGLPTVFSCYKESIVALHSTLYFFLVNTHTN